MLASIPNIDEIEVLVIDDKSTKDLIAYERLKNKYKHSNVKFFKNDTSKKGAGVCRNIGLKYIKGNWVVFADSDDFFVDGFFEIIKDYLDTNYDVVFFRPISIDRGTGKVSDRHQKYESLILNYLRTKDKKSELQLRYEFVVPWSKLINDCPTKS